MRRGSVFVTLLVVVLTAIGASNPCAVSGEACARGLYAAPDHRTLQVLDADRAPAEAVATRLSPRIHLEAGWRSVAFHFGILSTGFACSALSRGRSIGHQVAAFLQTAPLSPSVDRGPPTNL